MRVKGMYLRESSQKVDVSCRFSRGSLAKKLVPTQKYIGNTNQLPCRIHNSSAWVTRVVLLHLFTEQV